MFSGPEGIAVDKDGLFVYVTDHENNRIQKFDNTGKFLLKWGTKGSNRDGSFNGPEGIAVDTGGNVFVTDVSNYQVQMFDSNGTFITRWGTYGTAPINTPPGYFQSPSGIAVDSAKNVYVTDYTRNSILKFALVVGKADQTITFGPLAGKTVGDLPFEVSATASSGLPVSFSTPSTACSVSGTTVTIKEAGDCIITASQVGDGNYNAAPNVQQSFTIAKKDQTITFGPLAGKTVGDLPFEVSATASSGLPVSSHNKHSVLGFGNYRNHKRSR